jgi:hypothetical protein
MTPPTDELTRLLTSAADHLVERAGVPGPDTPRLWRQGRRSTWLARSAAVGLVAVIMLLVATGGLLLSGIPTAVPAVGGALTYPVVVSDMFPKFLPVGDDAIFGLVATVPAASESADSLVIERAGVLANLGTGPARGDRIVLSSNGTAPALAPDGRRVLVVDADVDPVDGSDFLIINLGTGARARPSGTDPIRALPGSRGVWSPDSRHVLVDTLTGPVVLDASADPVLAPALGDGTVRAAGWRDDETVIAVRQTAGDGGPGLDIVVRGLTDSGWTRVSTVAADALTGAGQLLRVFAAPDGSRLLLAHPADASGPAGSVLVDARTGARVPFAAGGPSTTVAWDGCAPVWRGGQPLLADGALRRPVTGESVMTFTGHREHGCVSLAGDELTGAPAPGATGAWQERLWRLWTASLPLGAVLALIGVAWMVLALRRSRKHGEDFLPMLLGRLF